jgi:hypothetical protein
MSTREKIKKRFLVQLPPHGRRVCTKDTPLLWHIVNYGPGLLGIEHHHPLPATTADGDNMQADCILLTARTDVEVTGSGSIILISLDEEGTTVTVRVEKVSH